MSTKQKNLHIFPHDDGWTVREEGSDLDRVKTLTQDEAIEMARRIAESHGAEVIIHGKHGEIREKRTYISVGEIEYEYSGPPEIVNEQIQRFSDLVTAIDALDRDGFTKIYEYVQHKRRTQTWVVPPQSISKIDEIMTAVQKESEEMSEDEINAVIDEVLDEVRRERPED